MTFNNVMFNANEYQQIFASKPATEIKSRHNDDVNKTLTFDTLFIIIIIK